MYYRSFKIQGLFKANGPFSRPFQGKFKAFSRDPFKFKAFSSLCEPCRKNIDDNVEMDDGNKDLEDQGRRNNAGVANI